MSFTENMTSGPAIDSETFFSDPVYQKDCLEYMTTVPRKEYSRYVSNLMDRLGYSYDMIKYRQKIFRKCDTLLSCEEHRRITTGGKGEGTALYLESDIDRMYEVTNVICADNPQHFLHRGNITLFQTKRQETSPGYTKLNLLKLEGKCAINLIKASLFESETGSLYMSSQFFTDEFKWKLRGDFPVEATSGPSIPLPSMVFTNIDNVVCFRCFCPDLLECWVSRPRNRGWPSSDNIYEISLLDGHVVPVGLKGSQNMYREWRICFSLAELQLMQNFNETQLKVYILLKKLCKSVFNPVCEDMTSYIMKNIVFWVCEANGIDRFTEDLLMDRIMDCIKYLRTCVNENHLPSYMIPDRNLLAGRLDLQKREQLTSLLSDLLHEGGRMLLRCDKLRNAMLVMYNIPEIFREFCEKRDKIESLLLMSLNKGSEIMRPKMSEEDNKQLVSQNEQWCDMDIHIDYLIELDVQALRQKGKTFEEISNVRWKILNQLLS